jgi:hypothetical protein
MKIAANWDAISKSAPGALLNIKSALRLLSQSDQQSDDPVDDGSDDEPKGATVLKREPMSEEEFDRRWKQIQDEHKARKTACKIYQRLARERLAHDRLASKNLGEVSLAELKRAMRAETRLDDEVIEEVATWLDDVHRRVEARRQAGRGSR